MTEEAGVSVRAEGYLRDAMGRLLAGKPKCTDGRLTKKNLCKEAGVSPATMFRAKVVLMEWDTHLAKHGPLTPGEACRQDEIERLRRELALSKREITDLQQRLSAAVTIIAAFHHDNQLLRGEHHTAGTVTELLPRSRD
nr:hypothetical protein OG499_33405 [Streptomyces anulatus]